MIFRCTLVGDLRRVRNVSLADDVTIPGLSEVIVDVYIEKDPVDELCSNLEFLIEPWQSYMEKSPLVRERPFNLKGGYGFFLKKYYDLGGKEIK